MSWLARHRRRKEAECLPFPLGYVIHGTKAPKSRAVWFAQHHPTNCIGDDPDWSSPRGNYWQAREAIHRHATTRP